MKLITQARPYAKAAFSVAKTSNALSAWRDMLAIASLIAEDERIKALLLNPKVSDQEKAKFFITLCNVAGSEAQSNYLTLLAQNDRLNVLPSVFLLFQRYLNSFEQKALVKVISAFPLVNEQVERLKDALKKRFKREIILDIQEDKTLLVGATLYIDDKVIDGSIKGRLSHLSNQFFEE